MTAENRKQPLHRLDRMLYRTPIYFVTTCTNNRRAILARESVHEAFVRFAEKGAQHGACTGGYVLMPTIFTLSSDWMIARSTFLDG
jgi:hypothetical protein